MNINESFSTAANTGNDVGNSDTLSKPAGTIKDNTADDVIGKMPTEIIALLVNMIVGMVGGLKPQSVGGSAFNSNSGSNFILKFPEMPSLTGGNQSSAGANSKDGAAKPLMAIPVLPSLMGSGKDGAKPVDSIQETTRGATTSTTSSNNQTASAAVNSSGGGSDTIFHVPPIPSLTGNSDTLPTVNATPVNTVPVNTTTVGFNATTGGNTPRTLNVNPLPGLVSPTTGSLSTTDLPKAFNPPAIPSLTGGSSELPLVSASDNSQVKGLVTSPSTTTTTQSDTIFHVPAVPSLLGSGTLQSLTSSLHPSSGVTTGENVSDNSKGTGSHWK
jgi:hypothetical protein